MLKVVQPVSGRAGPAKPAAWPQRLCRITTPGGLGTVTPLGNSRLFSWGPPPSPPLPSVFMGHWNKPARAVAPKVMILQLPPWHCHSRLPAPAKGSSREYHRRFAMDQDFSGERVHRKSAVRNEVPCCFPSSLSRRSQVKSVHIGTRAIRPQRWPVCRHMWAPASSDCMESLRCG